MSKPNIINKCKDCNIVFGTAKTLREHMKRKHQDKFEILYPKKVTDVAVTCPVCSKGFVNDRNFVNHFKKLHPEENLPDKYSNKPISGLKKCCLCPFTIKNSRTMINHLQDTHNIDIEYELYEFNSFDEFLMWKQATERETVSSYVKMHGTYKTESHIKTKYSCHRSGKFIQKGKGKRHLKMQGSKKINAYCPAQMEVVIEERKCSVKFLKTHVGHKQELSHLNLTEEDRLEIAEKIQKNVPFDTILNDISDSLSGSQLERLHLLKKKDLHNIKKSLNLDSDAAKKIKKDTNTLETWIEEMKSIVLFYKPQNTRWNEYPELKDDDFVLVIMNEGQTEILQSSANDTICIDRTNAVNECGFEMHALLALDDLDEAYPCAFLISDCLNEEVMKIFFLCVKEKIGGSIKPRVFMSDMNDVYYNAWLQVMEPSDMRLLCTWHVDLAWLQQLEKIAAKEPTKALAYQNLQKMMREPDVTSFLIMLSDFISTYKSDPETVDFALDFQQHYVANAKKWAHCYRYGNDLNINIHLERIHRTLKFIYLNGKYTKYLDKTVGAIMKFVRDKLFERLLIIHKGELCTKLKNIKCRHERSMKVHLDKITQTDTGWQTQSPTSVNIHVIQEIKKDCQCKLICTDCNTCLHQYSCSCVDSSINWNMCKHIHAVCRFRKATSAAIDEVMADCSKADSDYSKADQSEIIIETVYLPMETESNEPQASIVQKVHIQKDHIEKECPLNDFEKEIPETHIEKEYPHMGVEIEVLQNDIEGECLQSDVEIDIFQNDTEEDYPQDVQNDIVIEYPQQVVEEEASQNNITAICPQSYVENKALQSDIEIEYPQLVVGEEAFQNNLEEKCPQNYVENVSPQNDIEIEYPDQQVVEGEVFQNNIEEKCHQNYVEKESVQNDIEIEYPDQRVVEEEAFQNKIEKEYHQASVEKESLQNNIDKVLSEFAQHLQHVRSSEELDVIKNIIAPIGPILQTFRKNVHMERDHQEND